jgi:hypothetical protein
MGPETSEVILSRNLKILSDKILKIIPKIPHCCSYPSPAAKICRIGCIPNRARTQHATLTNSDALAGFEPAKHFVRQIAVAKCSA